MNADQAIDRISELILRERIRLRKGELAQAYIDLSDAFRALVKARTDPRPCAQCRTYRARDRAVRDLLDTRGRPAAASSDVTLAAIARLFEELAP